MFINIKTNILKLEDQKGENSFKKMLQVSNLLVRYLNEKVELLEKRNEKLGMILDSAQNVTSDHASYCDNCELWEWSDNMRDCIICGNFCCESCRIDCKCQDELSHNMYKRCHASICIKCSLENNSEITKCGEKTLCKSCFIKCKY